MIAAEWIISSSILILIIVAVRYVLKGKISLRFQYALWALVLMRLLLPFSIGESSISVLNVTDRLVEEAPWQEQNGYTAQDDVKDVTPIVPDRDTSDITEHEPISRPSYTEPDKDYVTNTGAVENPMQSENIVSTDEVLPEEPKTVKTPIDIVAFVRKCAINVWVVGMAAVGGYFVVVNTVFIVSLRKSRRLMEEIKGYPLKVYFSDKLETPCMHGLISPKIYVNAEAVTSDRVLRHVLEHESTHYRHGDHIWCILRAVALTVHWYNPLVWLAAVISKNDAELACDEGTLKRIGEKERAEYGRTLIGLTCQDKNGLFVAATTMTGSKKSIKERIILIAKKPYMAVYTLIVVLVISVVAVGCTFTGANKGDGTATDGAEVQENSEQQATTDAEKETTDNEDNTIRPTTALTEEVMYEWRSEGDTLIFSGEGAVDEGDWCNEAFTKVVFDTGIKGATTAAIAKLTHVESISFPSTYHTVSGFGGFEKLKEVTLNKGIKWIDECAFADCTALERIDVPDGLTQIMLWAFSGCTSLREVTLPENTRIGSEAFAGTPWLESLKADKPFAIVNGRIIGVNNELVAGDIIIPDEVTYIDTEDFAGNDKITSVTIHDKVYYIEDRTFSAAQCPNLKAIYGKEYSYAEEYAIKSDINFVPIRDYKVRREGNTLIFSEGTIKKGRWLEEDFKNVVIEEGITEIESNVFDKCEKLESITFPSTIKVIKDFSYCTNLKTIIFAEGNEWIEECAFMGCTSLEKIVIPKSITQIMLWAFAGCGNLKEIVLLGDETHIGSEVFAGTAFVEEQKKNGGIAVLDGMLLDAELATGDIVIPEGITDIETSAFALNENITSVTLPESIKTISKRAFTNCTNLSEIIFKGVPWYIGVDAFCGCDSLTEVVIPNGVKELDMGAFSACRNLKKVVIPESVTLVGDGTFEGCTNLKETVIAEVCKGFGFKVFKDTAWLADRQAENPLVVVNGVLVDGSMATGKVVIPEGVTAIAESVFCEAENIVEIVIPEGVTTLGNLMAYNCGNLQKITIPASVTTIKCEDFLYSKHCLEVICGVKGSYAESYAKEIGVDFEEIS